jgi:hypothetical protein
VTKLAGGNAAKRKDQAMVTNLALTLVDVEAPAQLLVTK